MRGDEDGDALTAGAATGAEGVSATVVVAVVVAGGDGGAAAGTIDGTEAEVTAGAGRPSCPRDIARVAAPPPTTMPPSATHAQEPRLGGSAFSRSDATDTLVCARSASSGIVAAGSGRGAGVLPSTAATSCARSARRSPARSRTHCPIARLGAGGTAASTASAIASAVSKRSAGSFASARNTAASSAGGI